MNAKTRPKKLIALLLAAAIAFSAVAATVTASAEGEPTPFSLLPLENETADVWLSSLSEEWLRAVPLSTILEQLTYRNDKAPDEEKGTLGHSAGDPVTIGENDVIVMGETGGGYRFMERSDTIDFFDPNKSDDYTKSLTLIIGSGKQLDKNNEKFDITVHIDRWCWSHQSLTLYTFSDGVRKDLASTNTSSSGYSYDYYFLYPNLTYTTLQSLIDEENLYLDVEGTLIDETTDTEVDTQFEVSFNTSEKTEKGYLLKRTYDYFDFSYFIGDSTYLSGRFYVSIQNNSLYVYCGLYDDGTNSLSSSAYSFSDQYNVIFSAYDKAPYPSYKFELLYPYINLEKDGSNAYGQIQKVVQGAYSSPEEAADAEDVTDKVFNGEYIIDYSTYDTGVDFTILYEEANDNGLVDGSGEVKSIVLHISLYNPYLENIDSSSAAIDRPTVGVTDPYFSIQSIYAAAEDGNRSTRSIGIRDSGSYGIQDSYYGYGYHTWFLDNQTNSYYDPKPVDLSSLNLWVNTDKNFNVYDATKSNLINFDEPQDFSGEKVQYTISNGEKTLNRFISIVMKSENGPRLYVCGPEKREIYFDKHYFGEYHDILIANPGNENLTGLKVEWAAMPRNVKIDDYWTVGGERNDTLEPLNYSSGRNNFAKIRLIPDGDGEVSGTLKISADGQEPYYIELTGHAGDPKIITESPLTNAVKYVPYNAIIATDKIHDWQTITFECYGLPEGLSMNGKTGEIYGVPQEAGDYAFEVRAKVSYTNSRGYEDWFYINQEFELTVLENTDLNVYNEADENYQILTPIGTEQTPGMRNFYLETENVDQLFVSNGVYGEFIDLWLNGQKLNRDVDYTVESGSTRITIKSQTFSKLEKDQTNTLAAEFRVDGDLSKDLKRTPQNFIIGKPPVTPPTPSNPGSTTTPGSSGTIGNTGNTGTSAPANSNEQNSNDNTSDPVQKVIDQIKNLPDTITEADRDSVDAARKAYDALTDEQKKRVENYEDLLDAEQALKDLEPEEDNEEAENYDDDVLSDDEDDEDIEDDVNEKNDADDENDVESNDDESSDSDVDSVENASNGVTLFGVVIDQNGTPISGLSMELHSTIQNISTDQDGRYQFETAEFGEHTLILTNKTTGVSVEKTFTLVESDRVSIQDNVIYAPNRTNVSLSMVFDGEDITFLQPDDPRLVEYDGSVPTGVSLVIFPGLLAAGALIAAAPRRKKRG